MLVNGLMKAVAHNIPIYLPTNIHTTTLRIKPYIIMGNTQPTNKTGKKVVQQKLENAKKLGVLSLSEHKLDECPEQVFTLTNLRTLDLSKNNISQLDVRFGNKLTNLKSLNMENNKLTGGTAVAVISKLTKLQNLSLGGNMIGRLSATSSSTTSSSSSNNNTNAMEVLPSPLPNGLKQLKLNDNYLSNVPRSIVSVTPYLSKLEILDLSSNQLASIPIDIINLTKLIELNLDNNVIVSLPTEIGKLSHLKQLSLRNNHITCTSTNFDDVKNPQPLPSTLFTDTPLIDLNLHGNPMTSTQLNKFVGYDKFLERRQQIKTNALLGGALTNLDVCGLE